MIQAIISAEMTAGCAPPPEYFLAPDVVLVLVRDGTGRLLDMGGTFYGLSATAAAMLDLALRFGEVAAASRLAALYGVEVPQVLGDLRRLLETLDKQGLVRRRGRAQRVDKSRRCMASLLLPPTLRCFHALPVPLRGKAAAFLALAYLSFRLFGLTPTIAAWQEYHRHIRPTTGRSEINPSIDEVDKVVRAASALHFLDTECKERALCCWSLLVVQGFPVELVFGIDLYPLSGHCWCQLDGRVLSDDENRCERFTPVATYT